MKYVILAVVLFLTFTAPVFAQSMIWGTDATSSGSSTTSVSTASSIPVADNSFPRMFLGGGLGLGFGDVRYFEVQPMIGVKLTPQFSTGVSLLYRYRKDTRYAQDLKTEDYGGTLFGRFHVIPAVFLQAEYEYLNYEYYRFNLSKSRDDFSSFLAGAGVSQPLGGNSSLYASALYNFSYDNSGSPYDSPWVYRVGVSFGF